MEVLVAFPWDFPKYTNVNDQSVMVVWNFRGLSIVVGKNASTCQFVCLFALVVFVAEMFRDSNKGQQERCVSRPRPHIYIYIYI